MNLRDRIAEVMSQLCFATVEAGRPYGGIGTYPAFDLLTFAEKAHAYYWADKIIAILEEQDEEIELANIDLGYQGLVIQGDVPPGDS